MHRWRASQTISPLSRIIKREGKEGWGDGDIHDGSRGWGVCKGMG